MRKIPATLILLAIATNIFSQAEKPAYRTATEKFVKDYNSGSYDSIFASFSPEMQTALPLKKTKEFFSGLETQAGKIGKTEFVKYKKNFAVYKTKFERALFAVNISVDDQSKINGLLISPFTDESLPLPKRNSTKLQLPFKGEWTVVWGGDTKELNYHVENLAQKNAFDIIITDARGRSFRTNGKTNDDYYAFGKELIAPCDGEVVFVKDKIKDNKPGVMNTADVTGNTVIIKTATNEYLFFAHFKQNSILVKEGQKVKQGELLGLCGNSGNSSEPHLHFHIQNTLDINIATGIKCFFDKIVVNGVDRNDYSPLQKEKIKNR